MIAANVKHRVNIVRPSGPTPRARGLINETAILVHNMVAAETIATYPRPALNKSCTESQRKCVGTRVVIDFTRPKAGNGFRRSRLNPSLAEITIVIEFPARPYQPHR